jgi:hypothetical protein
MSDFWQPRVSIASREILAPSSSECDAPPKAVYCEILNGLELSTAQSYAGKDRHEPFPVAQLKITREEFDADYFSWGFNVFVSERLREVMAFDPSNVRFFEVDASYSAPLPRSKNYQIMEVAATADVVDPQNSDYRFLRLAGLDRERVFVDRYAFYADVRPRHDLFYDTFSGSLLSTEAFALRILSSGCTGMRFGDPNKAYIYRTLRGIEEYMSWDAANRREVMQVVRAVN